MEGNANNYAGECKSGGSGKPLTAEELSADVVTPEYAMLLDEIRPNLGGIKPIETRISNILKYLDEKIADCEMSLSYSPGEYVPMEKLKGIRNIIEDLKNRKQTTCKDCKWRGTMKVRGRNGEEIYYCKNGYGLQQTILPENYCCMAEKE